MDRLTFYDDMEGFWRLKYDNDSGQQLSIDRLAAYEDTGLEPEEIKSWDLRNNVWRDTWERYSRAEHDNRLIVLPCKVGDTVYEPTNRGTISTYLVRGFSIEPFDSIWLKWDIQTGFVYRRIDGVNIDEIGKTVFLTREEAEAALGGDGDA